MDRAQFSLDELKFVIRSIYGEHVEDFESIGGYMSTAVKLKTDKGFRILKIYKQNVSLHELRFRGELLSYLQNLNFPAVRAVYTKDGSIYTSTPLLDSPFSILYSQYCAMFEFITGEKYTVGRTTQLCKAARVLGKYHKIVSDFLPKRTPIFKPMRLMVLDEIFERLNRVKHVIIDAVDAIDDRQDRQDRQGLVNIQQVNEFLSCLDQVKAELLSLEELEILTIHGDYRAQNILFNGDEVISVLDFDAARPAERLFDLSYALVFFQAVFSDSLLSLDERRLFLDTYSQICPLSKAELEALPVFLKLAFLRGLTLWLKIHYLDGIKGRVESWVKNYIAISNQPSVFSF